jgi:Cytochrome c7 and related cytochrome c
MARFLFPRWSNKVVPLALALGVLPLGTATAAGVWYYGTNKHFEVGYTPTQPVPYSHKLHAGDMGMDCRYCHSTVERSAIAAVPPTQTCMNCHSKVRTDSQKLLPVRESWATDQPIPWIKIHNLPDYVYFDHSAHLAAGVGCETCHGRVDQMIQVSQVKPLSMGWCIDCHRNPAPNLRDPRDITKMGLAPSGDAAAMGTGVAVVNGRTIKPPVNCSGCHR